MQSTGITDVGLKRAHNEDEWLADDYHRVVAVADGMGGHAAGEIASAVAVRAAVEYATLAPRASAAKVTVGAVRAAHAAVQESTKASSSRRGMGATLVVLASRGGVVSVGHVGDSRAYLVGGNGKLVALTKDHSLEGHLSHVVTRALGHTDGDNPDHCELPARAGQLFLLCTDGLTKVATDGKIAAQIDPRNLPASVQRLRRLALDGGGPDNITAVLVQIDDSDV